MENNNMTDSCIASPEQQLSALAAARLSWERETLQSESVCLSQELQGLRSSAARLSSERDALQGVEEKMRDEHPRQPLPERISRS